MCVCVCGIEPSSLVNEGGKGLSGKKTRKNNRYILILELDVHTHTHIGIHVYISL